MQHEQGAFVTPGLWVDRWDVRVESGPEDTKVHTFRFTHAVTPISPGRTRHAWRVSWNFALGEQAGRVLLPIFTDYYRRVQRILETMQDVLDADGPRKEINVSADAAASKCARSSATWWPMRLGVVFGGPHPQAAEEPAFAEQRLASIDRCWRVLAQCEDGALRIANQRISRPVAVRSGHHSRTELLSGLGGRVAVGDRNVTCQCGCCASCAVMSQPKASANPGGTWSPD